MGGDASEPSPSRARPRKLKLMVARARSLLLAIACATTLVTTGGAARADGDADAIELKGSVESGAALPSTSAKPLFVSLEFLLPVLRRATGTRLLVGVAPRALTEDRWSSNLPLVVALGGAGTVRVDF